MHTHSIVSSSFFPPIILTIKKKLLRKKKKKKKKLLINEWREINAKMVSYNEKMRVNNGRSKKKKNCQWTVQWLNIEFKIPP